MGKGVLNETKALFPGNLFEGWILIHLSDANPEENLTKKRDLSPWRPKRVDFVEE